MPDHRTMPDLRAIVAKALKRIDALERRLSSFRTRVEDEFTYNLSGTIDVAESGRRYLRYSARLVEVLCSLTAAGDTETIVGVYRNDALLDTVTIPAGSSLVVQPFSAIYGADTDYATVRILDAGDGAEDLTVQCRFG